MRRTDLEKRLAGVPLHPAPRPEWEQYRTPDKVAAELVWLARDDGAVEDKVVADLGCGTGVLGIAAALLGARRVVGVDLDPASVELAHAAAASLGVGEKIHFDVGGVEEWTRHAESTTPGVGPGADGNPGSQTVDTVIMNPPFGAQKANRHADRTFLDAACRFVGPRGTVWFLAQEKTQGFLTAYANEKKLRIERVGVWDYPLPAQFAFHEHEVVMVRVGGYRLARQ